VHWPPLTEQLPDRGIQHARAELKLHPQPASSQESTERTAFVKGPRLGGES
jgi:hypothetical protein